MPYKFLQSMPRFLYQAKKYGKKILPYIVLFFHIYVPELRLLILPVIMTFTTLRLASGPAHQQETMFILVKGHSDSTDDLA